MRLNAVWGLEPDQNGQDPHKANVNTTDRDEKEARVVNDCVDDERKLCVNELEDSELDRMILLF